ncbi:G5 domain-containing protein [Oceanobacillus oncorhynchi]|uniref:G5 domain-containing protein n=1 Tax=Oceanobacillus oncorhynchi TaxID=545501 RepID=UPI0034D661C1
MEREIVYAAVDTDKAIHTTLSVVDFMKDHNIDPSFENRLLLAEQYGIPHYIGSAAQNIQLLDILKDGGAQKESKVKQLLNINTSIVDYLKAHNIDSAFANRKSIAEQHGITNYIGSAVQNVELLRILKDINLEQKIALNTDVSVVDYMKGRGMDSSFDNRSSLAKQYGIENYRGTGEQNINLLNILKGDKSANNSVSSQKSNSNNKETEKGLEETTKSASSTSKQNNAVADEVKESTLPSKPVDNNKGKDTNSDKPTKPSEKPSTPNKPKDPIVDDSKEKDPVENEDTGKEDNGSTETPSQPEEKPETPVEEPNQPSEPVEDEDEVEVPSNPEPTEPTQPEEPEVPVEEEPEQPEDVVTSETTTETEAVAFEVVEENDPTLEKGQTIVVQEGQNGVRTITYKETYTNGKLTSKEQVSSEITQQPVNKIVKVGTKEPVVITTETTTETEAIAFETVYENDSTLEKGKEVVSQEGQNGTRTITYKETYENGKLISKEQVSSEVTKEPVKKIVKVGTKEAVSATQVLDGAGVFTKAGNTYSLTLGQGTDVNVQVSGDKVSSITFNASNYLGWDMPLETSIDLWGEERGKEEYDYAQSQRAKIEKAVRAAADAVYGKGTSQANSLYNQIINSEGYSESF